MLDAESTQFWLVAKESYPNAVVFVVVDGIYVVVGEDAALLARVFGIDSSSRWLAFDSWQAASYIAGLMRQSQRVILVRDGHTRELALRPERHHSAPSGTFLAVDPLLVFERWELEAQIRDEGLFEDFKRCLCDDGLPALSDFGQIYVYRFDRWYEVETELTTMSPRHLRLLAAAALDTRSKLPCRLVEPKPSRERVRPKAQEAILGSDIQMVLGQLKLFE